MEYDFGYKVIDFKLTKEDFEHAITHKTRMIEWTGPIGGDCLSGVDWDKINKQFPYYSFKCRECDYKGSDYNLVGNKRD